jgi:hypothetical protein
MSRLVGDATASVEVLVGITRELDAIRDARESLRELQEALLERLPVDDPMIIRTGPYHTVCSQLCVHETWEPGDEGYGWRGVDRESGRETFCVDKCLGEPLPVHSRGSYVWLGIGTFRFIASVSDGEKWGSSYRLFVKTGEVVVSEEAHRRMTTNLRSRARREHFRVQVRDREVTLISPMNDVVHVGDAMTAHCWLLGVD